MCGDSCFLLPKDCLRNRGWTVGVGMLVHAAVYEGKAKRVRMSDDGLAEIEFKDDVTAGNGKKHAVFVGKGVLCCRMSELLFAFLQQSGMPTHFLRRNRDNQLAVRRVDIIPLEVVVRFEVAGSLQKRTGLPYRMHCDPPVYELYYKRDDLGDPLINEQHVRLLNLATTDELRTIRELALSAALKLHALLSQAQLALLDLKFELGRSDSELLIADEISPDTCRLRDVRSGQVLDKDVFRNDLAELLPAYREVLSRLEHLPALRSLGLEPCGAKEC